MKFTCEQAQLNQAVAVVIRSVSPKNNNPALEGILLEVKQDSLTLTGYNLETGVIATIPASVAEPGSLVLSSRLFADIIRKLPNQMVHISVEDYWLVITCGPSQFQIMSMDAEHYPELPTVPENMGFVLPQNTLKSMISNTLFAITTGEGRAIHTGSLFEVVGDSLTIVSVDGFRLALRKETMEHVHGDLDFSFVVPGAALSEIEKICTGEESVSLFVGPSHILFRTEQVVLISRRLEGEFLAYQGAIPRNNQHRIFCQRRHLMHSIDRVSLMISEKTKAPLRCVFQEDKIELSSKTAMGEAEDICPMEGTGAGLEIGFNHRYLQEALRYAPVDTVRMEFSSATAPCLLLPAEEEDDSFCYMVLPVRLKSN